jgi:hypothetical protein
VLAMTFTLMLAGQRDHRGLVVHHRHGEGAGGSAASGCHNKGVGGDAHGEAGAAGQACGLAGGCAGAVVRADGGRVADRGGAGVGDDVHADVGGAGDHGAWLSTTVTVKEQVALTRSGCHHKGVGGHAHGEAGSAGKACGLAGGCAGAVVRADGGGVADVAAQALAWVIVHADVGRAADHWGLVVHHSDREGAGGGAAHGCHNKGVGGHAHWEAGAAGRPAVWLVDAPGQLSVPTGAV